MAAFAKRCLPQEESPGRVLAGALQHTYRPEHGEVGMGGPAVFHNLLGARLFLEATG